MNDMSAKAVAYALVATVAGALALALLVLGYWSIVYSGESPALYLPGKDFKPAVGQARVDGERLLVSGFDGESPRQQAVLSLWRQLDSKGYRFVTIDISQLPPRLEATLFWRKPGKNQDDGLYSQLIPSNVLGPTTVDMALNPAWTGLLSEIGLLLSGDTDSLPVSFSGISLEAQGVEPALGSLLTQWTGFRRFDQATINRLLATFSGGGVSPVPVAAVWAAVSLMLLMAASLLGRAVPRFAYLLVVLIVWMTLDLLWQRELSAQLKLSQQLFQGRSMAERHARDFDSGLYEYAKQLKASGLPAAPARLFILHNSTGHNFQRLKMQYYLLPHNIYNLSVLPPAHSVREGDYILALTPIPGLEFHSGRSLLRWGGGDPVSATVEHSHPMGKLFRVKAGTSEPRGPSAGLKAQ